MSGKPEIPTRFQVAKKIRSEVGGRWLASLMLLDGSRHEFAFDEFAELQEIAESGPDWNTWRSLVIYYNPPRKDP